MLKDRARRLLASERFPLGRRPWGRRTSPAAGPAEEGSAVPKSAADIGSGCKAVSRFWEKTAANIPQHPAEERTPGQRGREERLKAKRQVSVFVHFEY